ncbi:MAG: EF-hand domain-containing protein [Caulobacteraceae bacterium]
MPRPSIWPLTYALALACLTACASDEPRRGDPPSGDGPRQVNLFISPAGQPFRGKPGEPYPVTTWFAAADRDHDGRLSREEFRQDADGFFRILDANHDGVIDGFEVADYERVIAPEILPRLGGLRAGEGMDLRLDKDRGRGGFDGGDGGGRQQRAVASDRMLQGAGLFGLVADPEPVSAADADLSGKITAEEWRLITDRRFTALDKTSLGYLTLDLLPKTPAQKIYERPAKGERKR